MNICCCQDRPQPDAFFTRSCTVERLIRVSPRGQEERPPVKRGDTFSDQKVVVDRRGHRVVQKYDPLFIAFAENAKWSLCGYPTDRVPTNSEIRSPQLRKIVRIQ
jgi:hypothetical protein